MKNKSLFAIAFLFFVLISMTSWATTYYIDFASGNDTNIGTSTATAWKHAPGDANATGNPKTIVLQPGDVLLFKGGVNYRGQIRPKTAGIPGNPIIYKGDGWPGLEETKAIIDGSEPVTGWMQATATDPYLTVLGVMNPHYASIYWTRVKASEFPGTPRSLSATVLFEDRLMCRIASDPDQSEAFGEDTWEMRDVSEGSKDQKVFLIDTTLSQSDDYWNGAILRLFSYNDNAAMVERIVADYIGGEHKVVFNSALPQNIYFTDKKRDRYRFVNHPHILDNAGEFYVSGIETVVGIDYRRIYYWPKNIQNLTNKLSLAFRNYLIGAYPDTGNPTKDFYLVIDGFILFGAKGNGVDFKRYSGTEAGSNVIVRHCQVSDCGDRGISFENMNEVRVEDNVVRRCNSFGIALFTGNHAVFIGNDVGDTQGTNTKFGNVVTNSMMIKNINRGVRGAHGNGSSSYGLDHVAGQWAENILFAGNQYYNCNMAFNDSKNLVVFGNLFRGDETDPAMAITPWSSDYDGYQVWMNNTIPIASSYAVLLQQRRYGDVNLPRHYLVNNVLHGVLIAADAGNPNPWNYNPDKIRIEKKSHNLYTSYVYVNGQGGWTLNEGEKDCRNTPLTDMFVSPVYPDGDFHPKTNGPLHDQGINILSILDSLGIRAQFPEYDFSKDIAGNPRGQGGAWDIGAYEYVPTGPYLAVTAPSANTIWRLGTSHNIAWAYNEIDGNIKIDLYKSGTSQTIAQNEPIGDGSYSWPIPMDLTPGNDYFIKISSGTSEADSGVFSILTQEAPLAQTNSATAITTTSAVLNGTVNAHGLATTYYFEYGTTTSYGSSTIVTNAGSGENNVSVPVTISGLTANTIYHFRLVATNSAGTTNGNDRTFTTSVSGGGGGGNSGGGGGGGGGCFIASAWGPSPWCMVFGLFAGRQIRTQWRAKRLRGIL